MQRIVVDISLANGEQQHVAGNAAVVPPVEDLCRHIVSMALVVHLYDNIVLSLLHKIGHIETERGETAYVPSRLFAIHIDNGLVVHCTKIEQRTLTFIELIIEVALQPYRTLI